MNRLLSHLVIAGIALGACACNNRDVVPLPRTIAVMAGDTFPGTGAATVLAVDNRRAPAGFLSNINGLRPGSARMESPAAVS